MEVDGERRYVRDILEGTGRDLVRVEGGIDEDELMDGTDMDDTVALHVEMDSTEACV